MGKLQQLYTAVAASYGMFLFGLMYVWPSYTSSLYNDRNTTLLSAPMSPLHISLIGSLPSLGGMLGSFLCGKIIDFLGRRKGGLVLMLPSLFSWIIIDLTKSAVVIMMARFIGGFSNGASLIYGPIFVSEVAEKSIRGFLASGPIFFLCLGALTSYLFGWFLTYRYIIWTNMLFSCVGLILLATVKESPIWLLRMKKEAEARDAYAHYRGLSPESKIVLEEISRLKTQITPIVEVTPLNDGNTTTEVAEKEKLKDSEIAEKKEKISPFKLLFILPSTRRAFLVTGLAITTQIMMGLIAVVVYAKDIFSEAVPSLSPHLCSVMLATTLLFGTLASAIFTDAFGRRILLIISTVTVVLCLISIGLLIQTKFLPPWVTVILILVYCFAIKLGAGNLPYVLLAEVFIPEVQSTAAMILTECVWLLSFIQLGVFPFMIKYLGIHGTFYSFTIFGVIDTFVGIFLLPETKGLTNDEIQEAFLRKW